MRQNSDESDRVIDTLKFRTRFLIMRPRARARSVYARVYSLKVPQLPQWPLLQLTTSTYIGSSAAYVFTMYTSGSGTRPLAKSWELLASCLYEGLSLHASWAIQPLPSNVLARVHPWVSFDKSWLSFRLSRTPWLRSIVDFLNYASQILICVIVRHEELLFMRSNSKL